MAARTAHMLLHLAAEMLESLQHSHRMLQGHMASRCQHDALGGALQQRRTCRALEFGKSPTGGGQRQVAALRTPGDAASIHDRAEKP